MVKSNIIELNTSIGEYDFRLEDTQKPNLYKEIFPYDEIPKIRFNDIYYQKALPSEIWITDTTFRDGQQSMKSFTVEQIVKLFDYMHKLDNGSGIIRQTEFFIYSQKDKDALKACMEKGYKFPEITCWIRANKDDIKMVSELGIKETGMLMSCSDYHIFQKLNMDRVSALNMYIEAAKMAMELGIKPRCHLEDITRADFYGFVVPLVRELKKLSKEFQIPIKIRACDTLGLGVSHSGVDLPRGVGAIMHGLRNICKLSSEEIEWHGHNDFYSVVTNSTTAWLYGCASINTTLFGIGERTGNCPLEAMLIQYAQLKGNLKNVNLKILDEISEYFQNNMDYNIHPKTPFVGSEFNMTKAGIHADGVLKNEEIYNAFNTKLLLDRPIVIAVNEYSGLAGIAAWINTYFKLKGNDKLDKKDERVKKVKAWVDSQYDAGRSSVIRNEELKMITQRYFEEALGIKENAI